MTDDRSPIYSVLSSDPDFQELVVLYVDEMPARLALIQQALSANNREELARLVHQIKGSAGSHGFEKITPVAFEVEKTVRAEASDVEIASAVHRLIDLCRRITSEPKEES